MKHSKNIPHNSCSNSGDKTTTVTQRYLIALISILCFATILRFRGLDTESFWLDELTSLNAISKGTWRGAMEGWLSMVGMGTWLMYYWKLIVGDSDFALRSLSAISGVILVLIVAEFTRRNYGEKAGIIAGSMFSISHLAINYSQEFRPYMFTTTFIWISFLLMRLERKLSRFELILCIVFLSFSYLVHYLAGLVIVLGLFCDFVLRSRDSIVNGERNMPIWDRIKQYLASKSGQCLQICFAVAMLAIFMLEKMRYDSSNTNHSMWIGELPERPVVSLFDYFFGFDDRGSVTDIAEFMWYFVLLTPVILYLHMRICKDRKNGPAPEWFVWVVGGGTMLVVVLYSQNIRNLWVSRYFVFSMPAWYILFGIAISRCIDILVYSVDRLEIKKQESTSFFVAVIFSILFVLNSTHWYVNEFNYYEQNSKSDFKGMSLWLDSYLDGDQDDTYIISQPHDHYWNLYLQRMGSSVTVNQDSDWGSISTGSIIWIIEDGPFEIIHIRGHKVDMWGYENLELILRPDYDLVQTVSFIEGHIDVYHRTKGDSLA